MKNIFRKSALIASLCFSMTVPVQAQEMSPEFSQFILQNAEYLKLLTDKAAEINKNSAISCATVENRERLVPDILFPVSFSPPAEVSSIDPETAATMSEEDIAAWKDEAAKKATYPSNGQWIEHIRQNGCAVPRQLNVLAVALPGKAPKLFGMNSGTTIADPFLQDKAQPIIEDAVKLAELECKVVEETIVVDTILEGYVDQTGTSLVRENMDNGWQERWITSACGQRVDVRVQFLPDRKEEYAIKAYLYEGQ